MHGHETPWDFLVYADIDPKFEEEFNAWYNTEHLARIFHKKAQTSCKSLIEWKV